MTTTDDDLDAFLATALAEANQRKAIKQSRPSPADRVATARWIEDFNATNFDDWLPVANVAFFHEAVCNCGWSCTMFSHMALHRRSRAHPSVQSWARVSSPNIALPNMVKFLTVSVPMCAECSDTKGFPISINTTLE